MLSNGKIWIYYKNSIFRIHSTWPRHEFGNFQIYVKPNTRISCFVKTGKSCTDTDYFVFLIERAEKALLCKINMYFCKIV